MGLNDTPSANRLHIGFFGRRNAGKSSIVNAVTGQDLAIVSDTKGTTTDPVQKAMELLPLGPVLIIDTPGFDDEGALGALRVRKTRQILNKTDVAVLVVDVTEGMMDCDREMVHLFEAKKIPYCVVYNKCDLCANGVTEYIAENRMDGEQTGGTVPVRKEIYVSALQGNGIHELKEIIGCLAKTDDLQPHLVGDLIAPQDLIVLVVPIDASAPKGRLILPQQQVIRDVLDHHAMTVVTQPEELTAVLQKLGTKPAMVITDSQVFARVSADTPEDIPLTSFSILMARYKGLLETAVRGVAAIDSLEDGDTVLIAEGCTHHRQCEDIGTVKIPNWLKKHTGKDIRIKAVSGNEFPEDLSPYQLVIHCGGCMLPQREVLYRMKCAEDQGVPMTNYGITIAYMQGILKRSVAVFPNLATVFASE